MLNSVVGSFFLLYDCMCYVVFFVILVEFGSILFFVKNVFYDGVVIFKYLKYIKMFFCENVSVNKWRMFWIMKI